jgi:hypothetical protein
MQHFTWKSRTELKLKGESKKVKVEQVRYGSDGKLQKITLEESSPPPAEMETGPAAFEFNGKRLNETTFNELRSKNPGALIVFHFLDLPKDQSFLDQSVLFPGGTIAGDAMPWIDKTNGKLLKTEAWPLPSQAFAHPRSAGSFARLLLNMCVNVSF